MTIEKGQTWGEPAPPGIDPVRATGDADLARLGYDARRSGQSLVATVASGDLLNTLGLSEDRPVAERHAYPIDLGLATLDPETEQPQDSDRAQDSDRPQDSDRAPIPFVAHLVIGDRALPTEQILARLLGHGPAITVAVMNAAWLSELRLGPKAHPNDGRLDIVEGRVRFRERREAMRRARTGSHLPHPELRTTRTATWQSKFDRPRPVSIDGIDHGHISSIRVELVPDALTVVA